MKKIMMFLMAMLLSFTLIPVQLSAASDTSPEIDDVRITAPLDSAEFNLAVLRIKEIKAIDKSELNPTERKDLRNELNALTTEVKNSPYYYLSGGAILLIIILIILL